MTLRLHLLVICVVCIASCAPEQALVAPPWVGHAALAELSVLPMLSRSSKSRYVKDRLTERKLVVQDGKVTTTVPCTTLAGLDALELVIAQHAFDKAADRLVAKNGAGVLVFTAVEYLMVFVEPLLPPWTEGGDGMTVFLRKDTGELAWVWQGMPMWRELSPPPRRVPVEGNRPSGD